MFVFSSLGRRLKQANSSYSRRAAARSARTDMIYASAAVTTRTRTRTRTRTTTTTTTTTRTTTRTKTRTRTTRRRRRRRTTTTTTRTTTRTKTRTRTTRRRRRRRRTTTTTTTTTTKTWTKTTKNAVFYKVFVPWEAETTANSEVVEGQVAKNTVIYSVFLTQRQKKMVFARFLATGRHKTLVFTMVLAFLKIAVKLRQKTNIPQKPVFRALKIIENESKNGSKIIKNRVRATPHQRQKKNTLQTQKMNPKSWKTRGFFTFFWPRFGGRGNEQVRSVLFLTVFCEGERHDLSKTGGFFQIEAPPPQVNLNLSWLMPSGWSRPLHLRCGRILSPRNVSPISRCSHALWDTHSLVDLFLTTGYRAQNLPCKCNSCSAGKAIPHLSSYFHIFPPCHQSGT